MITRFQELTAGTKIVETTFVVLGAVAAAVAAKILIAFAPLIAIAAAIAAAIGVIVLVVEDLYQMFTGGRSVIAQALDDLFGIGTAEKVVEGLTKAFETVVDVIKFLGHLWRNYFSFLVTAIRNPRKAWGMFVEWLRQRWTDLVGSLRAAWDAVTGAITGAIEAVIDKLRAIVDKALAVYGRIKGLFGGPEALQLKLPARTSAAGSAAAAASRGVRVAAREDPIVRVPGGARGPVNVTTTNQITVSGANGDPGDIARRVVDEVERRRQADLRRVRDELEDL